MKKSSKGSMVSNIIQAILPVVIMAILGGVVKAYFDVHDLKLVVTELKGQVDWIYQYTFPVKK